MRFYHAHESKGTWQRPTSKIIKRVIRIDMVIHQIINNKKNVDELVKT
jgi:hypothetical protein